MDEGDRTAIHEVMEQQTVSIAKAGIVATLNARAAVLAAANPLYGRYHRGKSLSENVNLPNSLLSRFDLMFLVLDIADVDKDMALARHVTLVHQNEGRKTSRMEDDAEDEEMEEDEETNDIVPPRVLREYISRARRHQPFMPTDVAPYVVEAYVTLRQGSVSGTSHRRSKESDQTVLTARQLLSILRLSQALARLRFADLVAREDVDEAIRLTHCSKASLEDDQSNSGNKSGGDAISKIYQLIRDYSNTVSGDDAIKVSTVQAMVIRKGYTQQQFQACLEEYQKLEVWQVNRTGTEIFFL
jgi:DNA replication licensing factor MCM7